MKIKNGKVLLGHTFREAEIEFEEKILSIFESASCKETCEEDAFDASGCFVLPGLVDIHTHGAMGEDFSDGNMEGMEKIARFYLEGGVTSFLATTMTIDRKKITEVCELIGELGKRALENAADEPAAVCRGIHLEGPFISEKKKGAQNADFILKPDTELFKEWNRVSGDIVRLITVAPEKDPQGDFIREISKICHVSSGHTAADYNAAKTGFEAGADHATHLFNGMPSFLHRDPGVIGAAFDAGAFVELICDGIHIHPSVIRSVFRLFGEKTCLISDSIRCAGLAEGEYTLGGQKVYVRDNKAVLEDGTLAGSRIRLLDAVRNCVRFGIPLEKAAYAASTAPAVSCGLDKIDKDKIGRLQEGYAADILILDAELNIKAVFLGGTRVG